MMHSEFFRGKMIEKRENFKTTVHSSVRCVDALLQIAGRKFLGVPSIGCVIEEDTEIEIIEGPIRVEDSDRQVTEVVKVRHRSSDGKAHEGWIPFSFVLQVERRATDA